MTPIEIAATAFGLACVYLYIRENIWCWPTGIAMVVLYAYIFYEVRLYSDMALQVVYIFVQVYGWRYWLKGVDDSEVPITTLSQRQWLQVAVVTGLGTFLLGTFMVELTDADLPYWDATTTAMSLMAQFLIGRKKLENWLLWIAVDVLAIGIYLYKELYLTAGLYAVFLVMASVGYVAWRRKYLSETAACAVA
ncbi:MAG: nicotinamide riboside transporter PnuC [Alphaproteobacteria bacterium]|jgi:nicotinamide mononucleotide transporter|nr:nicotinamide riboside transporter PnuC [Alphaproteobacteria bacterium]